MSDIFPIPEAVRQFIGAGEKRLLIDGKWQSAQSGETFETFNPATGELLAVISKGGEADVDLAVAAARRAFEGPWSRVTPAGRQAFLLRLADLFEKHFEELALLSTMEMGVPITRQLAYGSRVGAFLRFYAAQAVNITGETIQNSQGPEYSTHTIREPIGVIGAITPWNGPIPSVLWKLAPVLASGCTMVLKPAEDAPLSPLRIAELVLEAGVPPGVVNVVNGPGSTAGSRLTEHPDVDKIAFTGSTATAQRIIRASAGNMKQLSLELGGKSPNIVFADSDLEAAAAGAATAIFSNTGQVCSAGSRLFVEKPIYEEFLERVVAHAKALKVGNGLDRTTQLGPVVSETQMNRVRSYMTSGQQQGARLLLGGERLSGEGYHQGYFLPPTIFADVRDDMAVATDEIFGPVLSAFSFETADEVVARANSTRYGLGGGVWTRDVSKVANMSRRLRAGVVWVNCYNVFDPAVPFGGYRMSGYGRELGRHHLDEYTNIKSVWVKS